MEGTPSSHNIILGTLMMGQLKWIIEKKIKILGSNSSNVYNKRGKEEGHLNITLWANPQVNISYMHNPIPPSLALHHSLC
jgi:hypothetical protein